MKQFFLALGLLAAASAPTSAQPTMLNIPALPPGTSAPRAATPVLPVTPTPVTSPESPSVTTLPTGKTPLPGAYRVTISGPGRVKAGEANTWSFNLNNAGQSNIHLEYGACDVRFEVLNAAGEVVRPDPRQGICTMQLVILDAAPGETKEVQKLRWEGKDSSGQPVPAGTYTIRARMVSGDRFTPAATFEVTVE